MRKQLAIGASATLLSLFIGQALSVASPSRFIRSSTRNEEAFLLNKICTSSDKLTYEGFEVSRDYDAKAKKSRVTIKKGSKVLVRHSDGQGLAMLEASCFCRTTKIGLEILR